MYLTVDFRLDYGYPLGSTAKHSNSFIELYDSGPVTKPVEDMQIKVENPLVSFENVFFLPNQPLRMFFFF